MLKKFKLIANSGRGAARETLVLDGVVAGDYSVTVTPARGQFAAGRPKKYATYADFERAYIMEKAPDGNIYHPSDAYTVVWQNDPRFTTI